MPEHYTKNTLECTAWCRKCGRDTQHRVDGGRRGPCLEHTAPELSQAQIRRQKQAEKAARKGPSLFEGDTAAATDAASGKRSEDS